MIKQYYKIKSMLKACYLYHIGIKLHLIFYPAQSTIHMPCSDRLMTFKTKKRAKQYIKANGLNGAILYRYRYKALPPNKRYMAIDPKLTYLRRYQTGALILDEQTEQTPPTK